MSEYFIFFRRWQGFREPFPFDRFDGVSDQDLGPALGSYCREQIRDQEVRQRLKGALRKAREETTSWLREDYPRDTISKLWRKDLRGRKNWPLVCRLGAYLGWWSGPRDINPSWNPRVWFWLTESRLFAEQLVSLLDSPKPANEQVGDDVVTVRFGFVEVDHIPSAELPAIRQVVGAVRLGRFPKAEVRKEDHLVLQRATQTARDLAAAWPGDLTGKTEVAEEWRQLGGSVSGLGPRADLVPSPTACNSRANKENNTTSVGLSEMTRHEYKRLWGIRKKVDPEETYVGRSPAILHIFEQIEQCNAPPQSGKPVLILGPSGVGKREIAELIHKSSPRNVKGFVAEHASTLKAADWSILQARWAGHGADSGLPNIPRNGTKGLLQEADGGTIFLDEIADVSRDIQDFLLLVLDRKPISKASGCSGQISPDVRLIFATNRDLCSLVANGVFRQDLLYRIQANTIRIPSLKDRKDDILLFVEKWCQGVKRTPGFLLALLYHDWPDEVRGLRSVIDRALANMSCQKGCLSVDLLELPTAACVSRMCEDAIQREICRFLKQLLEAKGFRKGKGLQKRIAEILNRSEASISSTMRELQD